MCAGVRDRKREREKEKETEIVINKAQFSFKMLIDFPYNTCLQKMHLVHNVLGAHAEAGDVLNKQCIWVNKF